METIDIATIVKSLLDWHAWLVLAVVALGGILGGYAHKLAALPDDKTTLARYLVVGMVASLAVLFVFTPKDPVKLIALSLAAGYGGKAVLDALEAKVKAAVAADREARAKKDGLRATAVGKQLADCAGKLSGLSKAARKDPAEIAALEDAVRQLAAELKTLEGSFRE